MANHQLGGGDDVHHPWTFLYLFSICHFSMKMILVHFLSESSFSLFEVLCVFYHTDCLEVILLVADEYFLIRFKLFSSSTKLLFAFNKILTLDKILKA